MALLIFPSVITPIRIVPSDHVAMLLWGVVCGAGLGVLWDVFRITRVLLGIRYPSRGAERLYAVTLPLLGHPVRRSTSAARTRLPRMLIREAVIFAEDAIFGVVWGALTVLLIYFTNDGIFRAMAPFGMVSGFLAYYHTVGRLVLSFSQVIVYLLRAALSYLTAALLLPPRGLLWLWRHTLGAYIRNIRVSVASKRAAARRREAQRLLTAYAEQGWLTEPARAETLKIKGGRLYAASKTRQKNDNRVVERQDLSDTDRCICHHLFCDQNDAEQQASPRKRGSAKTDRRGQTKGVRPTV